jgi:hypothetical protein
MHRSRWTAYYIHNVCGTKFQQAVATWTAGRCFESVTPGPWSATDRMDLSIYIYIYIPYGPALELTLPANATAACNGQPQALSNVQVPFGPYVYVWPAYISNIYIYICMASKYVLYIYIYMASLRPCLKCKRHSVSLYYMARAYLYLYRYRYRYTRDIDSVYLYLYRYRYRYRYIITASLRPCPICKLAQHPELGQPSESAVRVDWAGRDARPRPPAAGT